jgi:hypothetical protein
MADPRPLTMRELRSLSPRKLEELAAERGIPFPPRATSADLRQVLVGGGGTITTASIPRPTRASALEDLTVPELRKLATERGVKVGGKRRKADYVAALSA